MLNSLISGKHIQRFPMAYFSPVKCPLKVKISDLGIFVFWILGTFDFVLAHYHLVI